MASCNLLFDLPPRKAIQIITTEGFFQVFSRDSCSYSVALAVLCLLLILALIHYLDHELVFAAVLEWTLAFNCNYLVSRNVLQSRDSVLQKNTKCLQNISNENSTSGIIFYHKDIFECDWESIYAR